MQQEEKQMPTFLEDITPFYGTHDKNPAGQTLEDFLEDYDPYKYEKPSCTTDAVVFSHDGALSETLEGLKILMVKRSNHPSIGFWALPGGFIEMKEDLEDTAKRELMEETGLKNPVMEQFATFGDYNRDPRTRVITTAYMAMVDEKDVNIKAGDDAADAAWCNVEMELAAESNEKEAVRRTYILHFVNKEKCLDTRAVVEHTLRRGLIREEHFTVSEQGMIAVDHAGIVAQAMTILRGRLKE